MAGQYIIDSISPLNLWLHLLPLSQTTLKLLHTLIIYPKLFAEVPIKGKCDYNSKAISPPVTNLFAHKTIYHRNTWSLYGVDTWYIGAFTNH